MTQKACMRTQEEQKKKGGKNKNEEENIEVIYYTRAD